MFQAVTSHDGIYSIRRREMVRCERHLNLPLILFLGEVLPLSFVMAKSKNHTNHNQNRKDHRNGIKRPKKHRFMSMEGVDKKFLRNLKFAKKHNRKHQNIKKSVEETKRRRHVAFVKLVITKCGLFLRQGYLKARLVSLVWMALGVWIIVVASSC
uniref:60S ribosomal protein L29 n=1 Tax=Syphacia muris TaxID=451379 RepID=A0A0N5AJV0_9BILA